MDITFHDRLDNSTTNLEAAPLFDLTERISSARSTARSYKSNITFYWYLLVISAKESLDICIP